MKLFRRFSRTKISEEIHKQNVGVAESLGDRIFAAYPWHGKTEPLTKDACEALLNRSWRPELTVTGVDGMPSVENAGNVMRPFTTVKIGMRLPPDVDAEKASAALEEIITAEPPFNADVKYVPTVASNGAGPPKRRPSGFLKPSRRPLKRTGEISLPTWGWEPPFLW